MVSSKVVVNNPTGLHLRPAGLLCNLALEYTSKVNLRFKDTTANAKSILGVLAACVKTGDEIEIICEGPDEEEALTTIVKAIEEGLGEEF
jgi:phosphocarrier protein